MLLNKEMPANLKRVKALIKLGNHLLHFDANQNSYAKLNSQVSLAILANGWFTLDNIQKTFFEWGNALQGSKLLSWLKPYTFSVNKPNQTVALILAGNIPLVGFHDLICVWLSGHQAIVKCSSKDEYLLPYLTQFLEKEAGENCFTFTKKPFTKFDAVIATGSNNTGRYFEHYFSSYPNIIRKNRNGVAVLDGSENDDELKNLGDDIILYFGLGCRNVSKLFLPKGYDLNLIFAGLFPHSDIIQNSKYANNFDYNKAVFLMNKFDFLENGFIILKEAQKYSAPIACIHYEYYNNLDLLKKELDHNKNQIQCIISKLPIPGAISFGKAQKPELNVYADDIDTLLFLNQLN